MLAWFFRWVMMTTLRTEEDSVERLNRVAVLGGLVLLPVSLILGFAGYSSPKLGSLSVADASFGTIQLFVLDAPTDLTGAPLSLNVARFTAPLSLALATLAALLALLGQQIRRASLRGRGRRHVVFVGLSDSSADLLRSLRDSRTTVVVIEANAQHPLLPVALERGAIAIVGDGREVPLLRKGRVARASHVVVATGHDSTTLEVCEQLASLVGENTTVHAAIHDESLWSALGRMEIEQERDGGSFEFFHALDRKATTFVDLVHQMHEFESVQAVVFEGEGDLAQRVVLRWCQRRLLDQSSLTLHVSGATERSVIRPLLTAKPWLVPVLRVCVDSPADASAVALVCTEGSDGGALSSALRLAAEASIDRVFVCSTRRPGRNLLDLKGLSAKIRMVPAGAAFLAPATFFSQSWTEVMARARHEDYCANERSRGVTRDANPSLVAWEDLPESLRDSNRRFAVAVGGILGKTGARLAPLVGPLDPHAAFLDGEELEALARGEHERWMADLRRDGWEFAPPPKDAVRRTHPLLVPWRDLDEPEREKDRDAMRAIPRMLARVGYALVMHQD